MSKIGEAVKIITNNPDITPGDMAILMGLTTKQVYLLRSQAKAKIEKMKRQTKSLASSQTAVTIPKEWEEDAQQMAQEVKGFGFGFGEAQVKQEGKPIYVDPADNLFERRIEALEKELSEAKIIIKYLESKLMGDGS